MTFVALILLFRFFIGSIPISVFWTQCEIGEEASDVRIRTPHMPASSPLFARRDA